MHLRVLFCIIKKKKKKKRKWNKTFISGIMCVQIPLIYDLTGYTFYFHNFHTSVYSVVQTKSKVKISLYSLIVSETGLNTHFFG
jgi:hypothetical protein